MKRWYVVQTKPGGENIAEVNLERQGFSVYLPRMVKRTKKGRKPVAEVTVPLFPSYLFVQLDLDAERWRSVNGTYGVVQLVGFGQRPSALSDAVIDEIRAREDEAGIIRLSRAQTFEAGDKVEIKTGALADRTGIFKARTDRERIMVLLNLLGREVTVTVRSDDVTKVA